MKNPTALLEMQGITKRFPRVLANDNISFVLQKGEVHSLLGENGAGKSTLMNILYGLTVPDSGKIFVHGKETVIKTPLDAIDKGIGMVHQHFMLIERLTVLENILIGTKPDGYPFFDQKRCIGKVKEIIDAFGFQLDPLSKVADLSVGEQQRVEIIKALYRGADILILDEPTAVLTPLEVEDLFKLINKLSNNGHGIIFISHKLEEVLDNSTKITVLRQGKLVGTVNPKDVTKNELANYMVGRDVIFDIPHDLYTGEKHQVLDVKKLSILDKNRIPKVNNISFDIRSGEILGVAGVDGNGQRELVEALTGLYPISKGEVKINGKLVNNLNPDSIRKLGVAHIPEDRQRRGLVMDFRVDENLVLRGFDKAPFSRHGVLSYSRIYINAVEKISNFDIRPTDPSVKVRQMSGGNQQKVILARELQQNPKLIIAMQPTRGLDVGAIEYIQQKLLDARLAGAAILLVSTELEEVITLSDRIIVMNNGCLVGQLLRNEYEYEKIGLMMGGVTVD